ncbi:Nucleotide-binding_protein 1 [Hexamita inflata]|uniref:Nucleotide-binding_protein 1 n=1 Tax=Hexamita inflata TaxID=28002 RepID=A0ABP1GS87_9EUKA
MSCDGNCGSCASGCGKPKQQEVHPSGKCAEDKCGSCPSKGKCGSSMNTAPSEQNLRIAKSLQNFGHVILVLSGKGGVGKSTVSTQLAFYLSEKMDKKVGLMDVDVCGPSIPTMTNTVGAQVHGSADGWAPIGVTDNLQTVSIGFMLEKTDDAVIMRGPKKHSLIAQFLSEVDWDVKQEEFDRNYLIIDTPPGTTDEHLSVINLITQCSALITDNRPEVFSVIVSTPQEVALSDVRKEINFCAKINLTVRGVIENMSGFVCPCCNKETQIFSPTSGGCKKLCEEYKLKFLGRIPMDPLLTRAAEDGVMWGQLTETSLGLDMFKKVVESILE